MTAITQEQVDRLINAAIAHLDIASEDDRRTIRLAFLGAAENAYDLVSLIQVFQAMLAAVDRELDILGFETAIWSPGETPH